MCRVCQFAKRVELEVMLELQIHVVDYCSGMPATE
jgi:hypothetical protein